MQCTSGGCDEKAVFHLAYVWQRKCVREKHLCENHARSTLASGDAPPVGRSTAARMPQGPKQFDIDMIIISEVNDQQVVYLREVGGEQRVPILIGIFEATTLDRQFGRRPTASCSPAALANSRSTPGTRPSSGSSVPATAAG
jgi:hypothetical protein